MYYKNNCENGLETLKDFPEMIEILSDVFDENAYLALRMIGKLEIVPSSLIEKVHGYMDELI